MLADLVAIIIVLLSIPVCLVILWAQAPQFPDYRLHPITLTIKMWMDATKAKSAIALTPLHLADARIRYHAKTIDAPEELFPKHDRVDFGNAMIEFDGSAFHYLFVERGERYEERVTQDIDELLYWTFVTITWAIAGQYRFRMQNSRSGDVRRLIFSRQLKLLHKLNPAWSEARQAEIDEILSKNPYDDIRAGGDD